ncbi:hypothetical protein I7I48_05794 [Histoplasma ohiense]|nr:hypothetical protein I7I48_05794 [Histoplasma ohiense (nom. inval.)]
MYGWMYVFILVIHAIPTLFQLLNGAGDDLCGFNTARLGTGGKWLLILFDKYSLSGNGWGGWFFDVCRPISGILYSN